MGRSVPDARPHGRRRVRAGRGEGRARPSAPRIRDGDLHDRREVPASRLVRRRRRDHRRCDAVDDRRLRGRALRDADAGPPRSGRSLPRIPAMGEPPGRAEVGRSPLSGPRGVRRRAARLRGRRGGRTADRRLARRYSRSWRHAHPDRVRPRHGGAGRAAAHRLARRVQRARLRRVGLRHRRHRAPPGARGSDRRVRTRRGGRAARRGRSGRTRRRRDGRAAPGRSADPRAGRVVRAVRHEHARRS